MEKQGYQIRQINACGGGTKNPLWIQEHADATQRPVHLPKEPEAVLLGSAILGAVAAGVFNSIPEAMKAMCHAGEVVEPNPDTADYHAWKYQHQMAMYSQHLERRK
jgi:ribulose kinase